MIAELTVPAKMVYVEPARGWGLALAADDSVYYVSEQDACLFRLRSRDNELVGVEAAGNIRIPALDGEIICSVDMETVKCDVSMPLKARVVHSHPERGYGLAEMENGRMVFLHVRKAAVLRIRGGAVLFDSEPPLSEVMISERGEWIVFVDFAPAEGKGVYSQAVQWMPATHLVEMTAPRVLSWTTADHLETMRGAAAKGKETQAKLALEAEQEKERKFADDAARRARKAGRSGGGDGGGNKKSRKQRQHTS